MGHELTIIRDIVIGRKKGDHRVGIARRDAQQAIKNRRGSAAVARLHDQIVFGQLSQIRRIVWLMKQIDDVEVRSSASSNAARS